MSAPGVLLRGLLRHSRRTLLLGAAAGIVWQAAAALAPLVVGRAVDALGDGQYRVVVAWAGALLALGVVEAVCTALRHRQAITAYAATTRLLRGRLLAAVLRHDDEARATADPGRTTSTAETDVLRVSGFVDAVAHTVGYAVSLVVVSGLLVALDPLLAACVLVPLALAGLLVLGLRGRVREAWGARQEAVGLATSTVAGGLAAHEALTGLGAASRVADALDRQTDAVRRRGLDAARLTAVVEPAVTLLPALGLALVLLVGGTRAAEGTLPLGDVVAAAGWAAYLLLPVRTLAMRVQTTQRALASGARVLAVLEAPVGVRPPSSPAPATGAALELDGVEAPGLRGLDLVVPAGGRVAVLPDDGPGGAVLAALPPRLRDPVAGRVLVGGVDVRQQDPAALREAVVLVPRAPVLSGATVADAVREGRPEASDDEVVAALRVAAAGDVLARGLDAPLGEQGAALSGGQRQRVALARAVLARPRLLVLDGAGSALDAATEAELAVRLGAWLDATGTALLAVTDRRALAALAPEVVRLAEGAPVSGPVLLDAS